METQEQGIKSMLDKNEEILWRGKPVLLPYLFTSGTVFSMLFGILFTLFALVFVVISMVTIIGTPMVCIGIPFIIVGLVIVFQPLIRYLGYKNVEYAFSNRRVFIRSGLWAVNFKTIDFDKINNLYVDISFMDKLFNKGTGNVMIDSGEIGYARNMNRHGFHAFTKYSGFIAIENPYDVFKKLKEVALDIKTDIEYPNKLRPNENPGYKTKYKKS